MKACFICFFMIVIALMPFAAESTLDKETASALRAIQPGHVYELCRTMAGSEFAGRMTGHPGYTKAAKWAAQQYRQWGLRAISPKEGYLQSYPSPYSLIYKSQMTAFLPQKKEGADPQAKPELREVKPELLKDFIPLFFSDKGKARGEVVFAGWGIHAPELGYDDYAGIDPSGKFVLCFRGTPDRADRRFQTHDEHRHRMKTAKEMGALGLVYIYEEMQANPNGERIEGFLPAMISEGFADTLFKERGANCVDLKKALGLYKRPLSFPLQAQLELEVQAEYFPKGVGYNVAAYVEGSDPKLRNECIVLGGHYDGQGEHLGMIFAGADDNASGSAVVMEVARAFAKLSRKPRRSVIFVLFGGEEMGLMGSYHFADHLPAPFKKVDMMANFDMEGEGDRAAASYSAEPPTLKAMLEKADKSVNILASTRPIRGVGVRSSDFAPFYLKGAPCLSFFSNGPHLAYHQPGDSIYRINPEIMADIAKLAFLVTLDWANR